MQGWGQAFADMLGNLIIGVLILGIVIGLLLVGGGFGLYWLFSHLTLGWS